MDNKKPSPSSQSGRRKSGGSSQLRSPIVKRPSTAPVALQGWLHKQGSEGLMLWKKRWFVLSEYCLFYYKGPEEEKLLGSILLPSYKVSPCTAEDKVYRKFAFKAEHANMRTYYFAAETRELMTEWTNALSLATILQEGTKHQNHDPLSAIKQNSEDYNTHFQGSNSGFGPITMQPTSQDKNLRDGMGNVNGWVPQNPCGPYQPLYANAPPKPKRLNSEGQYAGSSPEASPNRRNDAENILCDSRRSFQGSTTPVRQQEYHYHPYSSGYSPGCGPETDIHSTSHSGTYSGNSLTDQSPGVWSSLKQSGFNSGTSRKENHNSNYSDVFKNNAYNSGVLQKPEEQNFINYESSIKYNSSNYQHPNQYYQSYQKNLQQPFKIHYQNSGLEGGRNNLDGRNRQPPRPHSADFLDYDAKKYYPNKKYSEKIVTEKSDMRADQFISVRPPRPKSSLDIMHSNDGYYWSEEHYAEKMRQSAMYLQSTLPQRSHLSGSNTPVSRRIDENNKYSYETKTIQNEQVPITLRQKRVEDILRDLTKSPSRQNPRRWSEHQDRLDNNFIRSASARLPKQRGQDEESDEVQAYTGGEDFSEGRKEESMKRLLEWKQRMLQSPLTRKSSGSSTRGVAQNELSRQYKQQVLKELEKQEARSREELGKKRENFRMQSKMSDGRRSALLSADRYYSYSSDDEEHDQTNEEKNRKATQFRKTRKEEEAEEEEEEEGKGRKSTDSGVVGSFSSPNYENVSQAHLAENRIACFLPDLAYEREKCENYTDSDQVTWRKKQRILKTDSENKFDQTLGYPFKSDIGQKKTEALERETKKSPASHDANSSKKSNWNKKIDETKLIKEFSYQYIKDPKTSESNTKSNFLNDVFPENIVKSRKKQLGLDVPDSEKNDDPKDLTKLASSNYYLNEAYITNLKNADAKMQEISLFALGDTQKPKFEEPISQDVSEKHQKSVKDLLADFEKKSQLVQEREALEHEKNFDDVSGKRCVFSDTETLLYDTSSDTEEKKPEPDSSILTNLRKFELSEIADELTEEEDRDEEVAAALCRRERFFSSCRELGRKKDSNYGHRNKRLSKLSNVNSPSNDIEKTVNPDYVKSTVSEAVTPLENLDVACVTPTIEKIKDNLEDTSSKENSNNKVPEVSKEEENCEGHYMPMTPSRRISAPPSDKSRSDSSLHSFLFGADAEETYVEMSENGVPTGFTELDKSFPKSRKSLTEQDRCSKGSGKNSMPHYDFLPCYRSGTIREPEYMEVNTLLEILKEQDEKLKEHRNSIEEKSDKKSNHEIPPTPPRSALPDILNSSASRQAAKSDSSDADDESSKDLDSLDIPRHPRFSLSDTFRPASYYLGSVINDRDRNIIRLPNPIENHDSSDSDLVSPPPIPTSPPPLDDLDTSLETERSLEIRPQNLVKFKQVDKDASKKLWNSFTNNQDLDNVKDIKKKKRRPVSEDMLDTLDDTEQFFNEKPLVFSELDSIGKRNGLALDEECGDINLDQYLEELELNSSINAQLYSKNISENIYKSSEKDIHKNLMTKESVNKMSRNEKSLLKMSYGNDINNENCEVSHERTRSGDEVQYENLQTLFPPPPPELYESSNEHSDRESNLTFYRNTSFPEVPPPDNYCDAHEPAVKAKICFDPDTLQHQGIPESNPNKNSACFETQGAPYYYSDIIKNDECDFGASVSERSVNSVRNHLAIQRYQPLNNQRENPQEINQCFKRNDIGRKVNPISQNYLGVPMNESSELDDVEKITAELRTTSAHFMGDADKSGTVDIRNIYESDTLQRRKSTDAQIDERRVKTPDMHHPQGVARNLYPQGLKSKFSAPTTLPGNSNSKVLLPQSRVRSRSVEGLLNESDQATDITARETSEGQPSTGVPAANNSSRNHPYEGGDLWDKDTLWRENLRKVSLRHTRTLDNLGDDVTWNSGPSINTPQRNENVYKALSGRRSVDHFSDSQGTCPTGRRSADHFSNPSKNKLSRNVTYVNDVVRKNNKSLDMTLENQEDYREAKFRPRKKESEVQTVVVLSDSGVLDCDDGVHYEKLTRNPSSVKQISREENFMSTSKWTSKWDQSRESKRSHPVVKDTLPKEKHTPNFTGENTSSASPQPLKGDVALEPLDREKLRQWDLMSSGTVEQEVELRKTDRQSSEKESSSKKLEELVPMTAYSENYEAIDQRHDEKKPQELAPSLEASGSGSVMREPHFPYPDSPAPQSESIGRTKNLTHQSAPSPSAMIKDDSLMDQKSIQLAGRSIPDFNDRVDYYDRIKTYSNGYSERNDAYSRKREDMIGGDDLINNRSDRVKSMGESNYYADQYQERKLTGNQRNCGSLPMSKSSVPLSSMNAHNTSSLGRSVETSDGRYLGKDKIVKKKIPSNPWGLDVSAGELLGRTHEELVLLLIQLRRQSASVCKAMESCHIEIEEQARLSELDTPKRLEHLRKLEKLKKHLLELEKQYEKGKPLVNLVDNMVKLGSLYKGNNNMYNGTMGLDHSPTVREKLEFNQKVQEQRLLAEERRDWDRLSSDHGELQAKVQQLYKLDRLLQEESGTLHILQQDKELLEKALGGLRHKLQVNRSNPVEADRYRKQQKLIEKELSRVRLLLAHNSKKLEETVAENARLEQELVILRQKLQASRVNSRNSVPLLPESATLSTTAALEAELRRVQQLVGDLQRQRHELSAQVKQLTEKNDTLVQQIRPGPTGVAGAGPIPGKKKSSATWLETDLDLLITQDVGVENQVANRQSRQQPTAITNSRSSTPMYINTESPKKEVGRPSEEAKSPSKMAFSLAEEETQNKTYCTPVELSEADERMKRFYGIIPREKQEIKTVRIVKRESERRQRDRDRSGNIGIPIGNMAVAKRVSVIDENDGYGLGRVEEEAYDPVYNPTLYKDVGDDSKIADYQVQDENHDLYLTYNSKNPFLSQKLPTDSENLLVVNTDPMISSNKKSMSLPRGFGNNSAPNRYEGNLEMRNSLSKRNRVRFESNNQEGSGSESGPNSPRIESPNKSYGPYSPNQGDYAAGRMFLKSSDPAKSYIMNESCGPAQVTRGLKLDSEQKEQELSKKEKNLEASRPLSAREQLFGSNYFLNDENSPQLSPVYQSEAAREIILEMSGNPGRRPANRRQFRREKRRHHTVSNIRHIIDNDNHLSKMGSARSRDDLDMERALRPRMNAPDVVRSTMNQKDLKYNESTIDNILGTPNKILIPERYIPEQEQLTVEEQMQRSRKAESIRKMLSETTAISTPDLSSEGLEEERKSCTLRKKVEEEKKQREHLLELNQILAQQVMEKSKLVAGSVTASSHQQD